ncbi:hypothetical protein [Aquimarina pacifica]|uniref:hypothetical protein n=1 Tax=Aquimarina pacifica TaxID=1296415 RepID=UPI00046EEB26|nr:hypothetical protein [Aquimarina pacifica]
MKKIIIISLFILFSCSSNSDKIITDPITGFTLNIKEEYTELSKNELLERFLSSHKETLEFKDIEYDKKESIKAYNNRPDTIFLHVEKNNMNYLEASTFPIYKEYQNDPQKEKGYVDMMYNYIKENMLIDIRSENLTQENLKEDVKEIDKKDFRHFSMDIFRNDSLIANQSFYIGAVDEGVVFLKIRSSQNDFKLDINESILKAKIIKN